MATDLFRIYRIMGCDIILQMSREYSDLLDMRATNCVILSRPKAPCTSPHVPHASKQAPTCQMFSSSTNAAGQSESCLSSKENVHARDGDPGNITARKPAHDHRSPRESSSNHVGSFRCWASTHASLLFTPQNAILLHRLLGIASNITDSLHIALDIVPL